MQCDADEANEAGEAGEGEKQKKHLSDPDLKMENIQCDQMMKENEAVSQVRWRSRKNTCPTQT